MERIEHRRTKARLSARTPGAFHEATTRDAELTPATNATWKAKTAAKNST